MHLISLRIAYILENKTSNALVLRDSRKMMDIREVLENSDKLAKKLVSFLVKLRRVVQIGCCFQKTKKKELHSKFN